MEISQLFDKLVSSVVSIYNTGEYPTGLQAFTSEFKSFFNNDQLEDVQAIITTEIKMKILRRVINRDLAEEVSDAFIELLHASVLTEHFTSEVLVILGGEP